MNDIMKIIKCLDESDLLVEGISKTIKIEAKKKKAGFLSMLLGTLSARILRNLLRSKGLKAEIPGQEVIRAGKRRIKAGPYF